jgi:hypothetical protein
MSNHWKAVFVNGIFCMQSFLGDHGEILPRPGLVPKVWSVQIFPFQQPNQVWMTLTRRSLTVWCQIMNHHKAERVTYQLGIRQFGSFKFA